jgi:hypothetical protein
LARFLWVNPEQLERAQQTVKVECVDLIVELSPFKTPKAVSGEYDPKKRRFNVAFQYLEQEPEVQAQDSGEMHVIVGKHTGKIIRIAIPIEHYPLDKDGAIRLRADLTAALTRRRAEIARVVRPETTSTLNVDVAEEILEQKFNDLVGAAK